MLEFNVRFKFCPVFFCFGLWILHFWWNKLILLLYLQYKTLLSPFNDRVSRVNTKPFAHKSLFQHMPPLTECETVPVKSPITVLHRSILAKKICSKKERHDCFLLIFILPTYFTYRSYQLGSSRTPWKKYAKNHPNINFMTFPFV